MAKKPKPTTETPTLAQVRQRIVRTVLMPARELKANALNFRRHGEDQRRDVSALLEGIGQVAPVIGRDMPDGSVELLDGHLRQDIADDRMILVAVTDLNDAEAATMLAMLDYTAGLATIDPELARQLAAAAKPAGLLPDAAWDAWAAAMPQLPVSVEAPSDFPTVDENLPTDHECPRCGYRYSGGGAK